MSTLFYSPRAFVIDGAGAPRAGAKLFAYQAGTLTAQDTYSDAALATPNTNPVVANSAGEFGPIYLSNTAYRFILKDSADVQLWDQDDYNAPLLGLFGANLITKTGNYTVVADDKGKFIQVTAAATITLIAAVAGFSLAIENTSTGNVVIDPNSTEQINGASTITLYPNEWAILTSDGTGWRAIHGVTKETGSFTVNFSTGFTTTPSSTFNYTRVGTIVTLHQFGTLVGTSNTINLQTDVGDVPAHLRPSESSVNGMWGIEDNGTHAVGKISVRETGQIIWFSDQANSGFTASGDKGFVGGQCFTYLLD